MFSLCFNDNNLRQGLLIVYQYPIPSDAGRDWGWEEKGMTEDEMAGWHRWLDGPESE